MYGDKRIDKSQVVPPTSVLSNHQVHLQHHHHIHHQPLPIIVPTASHTSHPQHQNHHQHHQLHTQQQQQHLQAQPHQQSQQSPNHSNQQQSTMFSRFDANKSTKGASKLRRDLINAEIANLRDLLPLPQSTRQRLSQLQLMALVCVYVRKANYFQQVFKRHDIGMHHAPTPNIGFSKALSGFLMMLTQNGKLLYISDNAAEYLGHSMEDLLIHGDSVYDIIDKQDHSSIQAELNRNVPQQPGQHGQQSAVQALEGEHRMFLCRMNVSRNARRQMRFGDQKVVLVQGHYLSFLPLCSRNEPVFLATCTPIAMPETRECVVQGATNVFTTIHSMDMKVVHIDKNGEFHLGYNKTEIQGLSWYNLLHWDNLREAQNKHRLITQSEQDRSCILLVRMQRYNGEFIWVHVVLQVRDGQDSNQQPVIVCTNQVLNEREASVMIANSWLYHYYSVQSKIQFGIPFEGPTRLPPSPSYYHHGHHHSPTLPPSIPHGYPAHHHLPYGYHSPVGITAQSSPIISHHHNGNNQNGNGIVGPYSAYRIEPISTISPVDYSSNQNLSLTTTPPEAVRCSSTNSSNSSNTPNSNQNLPVSRLSTSSPPPSKRRAVVSKLEPLYLIESNNHSPESNGGITDLDSHYSTDIGSEGGVTFGAIFPTRHRILTKAPPADPPDFIDQWNPSPPWSETAQKVPDIAQQELSPYLTTTPPTPTSAPAVQTIGPAFSFDWMSEQFVPIMDSCSPCLQNPERISIPIPITHHWQSSDHRILSLQPIGNHTSETDGSNSIPSEDLEVTDNKCNINNSIKGKDSRS